MLIRQAHTGQSCSAPTMQGILPQALITVVDVKWHGSGGLEPAYKALIE
jgi:hypothetical protein